MGRDAMKALDVVDAIKRFYNSSAWPIDYVGRTVWKPEYLRGGLAFLSYLDEVYPFAAAPVPPFGKNPRSRKARDLGHPSLGG